MKWTRSHRADARITLTLAGLLMVTACASCSPSGAGSISVPGGKSKLKAMGKGAPSKAPAAMPPGATPRKR
jgi:hypothetical protein